MHLSEEVISYIQSINIPKSINSNFLISDLEKIIYTATYEDDYYISKPLNNDLLALIEKWKQLPVSEDLLFMENDSTVKLIDNDIENYSAQMIFPIYLNNSIEGLVIYFRNSGKYINSSPKAPNTIRKWIMKLMGYETFPVTKNIF